MIKCSKINDSIGDHKYFQFLKIYFYLEIRAWKSLDNLEELVKLYFIFNLLLHLPEMTFIFLQSEADPGDQS